MTEAGLRLSVCIPTHNRAAFIGPAIESVIGQATETVEIVVSDNASSDNTEEIVQGYRARFRRLRYFRWESNVGADRNYLKAIELSRGEFCWFLGSDDQLGAGAVARVLSALSEGVDVIVMDRLNMSRDMRRVLWQDRLLEAGSGRVFCCDEPAELREYFRSATSLASMFSYISCLVVRREEWEREPVLEAFLGSAWIHVVKIFGMLKHGARVLYLGEPLVLNRTGNDSFYGDRGFTRRRLIDLDYVRIARVMFGGEPEIERMIVDVVAKQYFGWRVILSDKRWSWRLDGQDGLARLRAGYHEAFRHRLGYGGKMLVWGVVPPCVVDALHALGGLKDVWASRMGGGGLTARVDARNDRD